MTVRKIFCVLFVLLGIVGAALSVAMVVRAVQFSEWGRVILYSVALGLCVEMAVLSGSKLKSANKDE